MPSRHAVSIDVVLECPPHASLHRVIDLTTINEDFTVAISNAIARALHNRRVTIDAALPFRWLGVSYLVRVAAIEPMPLHRSRPIRIRSCRAIQQLDDDDDSDEDDGYADDTDTALDRYSRRTTTSASDSALEQPLTRINLLNSKNSPNDRYLSIESNRVSSTAADSATASSPSPSSSLSFLTLKRDAQVVGCTQQLASLNRLFGAALLQHKLNLQAGHTNHAATALLLWGPAGVGKTLLIHSIECFSGVVVKVDGRQITLHGLGESERSIRSVASNPTVPAVVIIDHLDAVAGSSTVGQHSRAISSQLLGLIDELLSRNPLVLCIGVVRDISAIQAEYRRAGRFDRDLFLQTPDFNDRLRIIQALLDSARSETLVELSKRVAHSTAGYTGNDLKSVCRTACLNAVGRALQASTALGTTAESTENLTLLEGHKIELEWPDFALAIGEVRPANLGGSWAPRPPKLDADGGMDQVVGCEEAKRAFAQTIEWPMQYAASFERFNIERPKGILLYGPSGCGKTMIVNAFAAECNVNFLSIKGPQLFSKYLGDTEKSIRWLFKQARIAAPTIIFLDEIDAVGLKRGDGEAGGGVQDRALSTLLNEMDGIEASANVFIIGCTNRPDMLDEALIRPGRLSTHVHVPLPDWKTRYALLERLATKMPLSQDVDLTRVSDATSGLSCIAIKSIMREAAMVALRNNVDALEISKEHVEQALASTPVCAVPASILSIYDMFGLRGNTNNNNNTANETTK